MPFIGHTLIYTCILIYIPTYPSATHDQTNILTSHAMFIVYLDGSRGSQGTFPLPEMVNNFGLSYRNGSVSLLPSSYYKTSNKIVKTTPGCLFWKFRLINMIFTRSPLEQDFENQDPI